MEGTCIPIFIVRRHDRDGERDGLKVLIRDRFMTPDIAKKYDLELREYEGIDQVVEWNCHREGKL